MIILNDTHFITINNEIIYHYHCHFTIIINILLLYNYIYIH